MLARRLRELTLWIGALLGLVAITAGVATTFFGFSFLVFRSGSMEPSISTGGLALSRTVPADEISAGDDDSVMTSAGDRVTHRVVSTTLRDDTASLVLQGDANGAPDSELYEVTTAERVVGSVPHAGYALAYLLTPAGLIGATCLALMVVVLGFGDDGSRPQSKRATARGASDSPPRHRAGRNTTRSVLLAGAACLTLAGSAAGIGGAVSGTWATFTDRATVTTGEFTSGTLTAPGNARCASGGLLGASSTFAWSPPSSPPPFTNYVVSWTRTGPTGSGSVTLETSSTSWRPTAPGTYTIRVRTTIGAWSSPLSSSDNLTVGSFLGFPTYSC